jgi:hypothetical protein
VQGGSRAAPPAAGVTVAPGVVVQTTATAVLFGTFAGTTCLTPAPGSTSCALVTSVFPTATTFAVVTHEVQGINAAARPTPPPMNAAMALAAGVMGVVGAVLV